jgi:hypothetical protein
VVGVDVHHKHHCLGVADVRHAVLLQLKVLPFVRCYLVVLLTKRTPIKIVISPVCRVVIAHHEAVRGAFMLLRARAQVLQHHFPIEPHFTPDLRQPGCEGSVQG